MRPLQLRSPRKGPRSGAASVAAGPLKLGLHKLQQRGTGGDHATVLEDGGREGSFVDVACGVGL